MHSVLIVSLLAAVFAQYVLCRDFSYATIKRFRPTIGDSPPIDQDSAPLETIFSKRQEVDVNYVPSASPQLSWSSWPRFHNKFGDTEPNLFYGQRQKRSRGHDLSTLTDSFGDRKKRADISVSSLKHSAKYPVHGKKVRLYARHRRNGKTKVAGHDLVELRQPPKMAAVLFIYRRAIVIFCIIGCLYQLNHIRNLYLSYESTVQFSYNKVQQFELPTVSICFQARHLFNWTKLSSVPEMKKSMRAFDRNRKSPNARDFQLAMTQAAVQYYRNRTTTVASRITLDFDDIVDECMVLNPSANDTEKYVPCNTVSTVKTYLWNVFFKCFVLFHDERILLSSSQAISKKMLSVKGRFNGQVIVFLDSNGEMIGSDSASSIRVDFDHYKYVRLWFSRTIRKLLPSPFSSDCKDFTKFDYTSGADCVRKCMVRVYKEERANVWPKTVPAPDSVSITQGYELGRNNTNIEKRCTEVCEPKEDCLRTMYKVQDDIKIPKRRIETSRDRIQISVLRGLETTIALKPKLDEIELFSYIASAISMWFGFSVLTLTPHKFFRYFSKVL
ncbi:hypothetical protein HDE_10105 [Halotydeus destructor]|nr:hypothetical protein HDE_10105 [Halotydeus destructor]